MMENQRRVVVLQIGFLAAIGALLLVDSFKMREISLTRMTNGFDYTDNMPWSSGSSSDKSPDSLHNRLVRMGGHNTAQGIEDLCDKLMAGGAEAGTGWNPGHSAADYIMCGQTVRPKSARGRRSAHRAHRRTRKHHRAEHNDNEMYD
mmetsp:Transcript_61324/g.164707  ORF Transcript_61324/g.164707 Transcript_61324/m.164707 type:complete len:147 (+) Transcript_61324:3-443(+)